MRPVQRPLAAALLWWALLPGASEGPDPAEFRERILSRHPAYLVALDAFALACLDYEAARRSRFPVLSLSLSPSYAFTDGNGTRAETSRSASLGTSIALAQSMPGGGRLTGSLNNAFSLTRAGEWSAGYAPSAALSVESPAGFASPALAREQIRSGSDPGGLALRVAYLELSVAADASFASTVSAIGEYLLALRRAGIAEDKWRLLEQKSADAFGMWRSGRATTLELTLSDVARSDAYAEVLRAGKALLDASHQLALNGQNAASFSGDLAELSALLDRIDSFLSIGRPSPRNGAELEWLRENERWRATVAADLARLPSVGLSLAIRPRSDASGSSAVWDSVREFWAADIGWNWSASLSVSLPVDPRNDAWRTGERFAIGYSMHESKLKELALRSVQAREYRERTLALLREGQAYAQKNLDAARERLELCRSLVAAGRLPEIDALLQEVALAGAECDWLQARLDSIVTALGD